MKFLHAIIVASIAAASAAVAQKAPDPAKDIRQRIDEEFDNARLKSIVLEYERQETREGTTESRTILFVKDGQKFFLRTAFPSWIENDASVDPPMETTHWTPDIHYLWGTEEHAVLGYSNPGASWRINPPGVGVEAFHFLDSLYYDLNRFLWLSRGSWFELTQLIGQRDLTNGIVYILGDPGGAFRIEYFVSDHDGGGVAPIRSKDESTSGLAYDSTWSGWMNYNGIWVPRTSSQWGVEEVGGPNPELVEVTTIYTLLRVQNVNEPIHARWFMPQFPAGAVTIEDHTVSPPLEMDNINLDGISYTGFEVYE